ncbi:MAG: nuclear transport factor 2 family protein, partial [Terriglobia bacterium]
MSPMTTVSLGERLKALHRYIREGRIIEAMNEFYDQTVTMQDNANPPTVGLEPNIERESQFLKTVKEWNGTQFKASCVGKDVTFYETVLDWIATDGTPVHREQMAVAHWKNGKIVQERFYYDTG